MGDNIQIYTTNLFEKATVTATSNSAYGEYVLDNNNKSFWASQGSSDGDTQVLTLTLDNAVDIDTILVAGNNFKTGTIQYYNGSWNTAVTVSSVLGDRLIDLGSVKTDVTAIRCSISHTEVVDEEKYCSMFIGCLLRFELSTNPRKVTPELRLSRDIQTNKRGQSNISRNGSYTFNVAMDFNNIGTTDTLTEFNNLTELLLTGESFLLNLTGDTEQNRIPYTWNDIRKMAISKNAKIPLSAGCHSGGNNLKINMIEVK